ncbi:MAG: hypothetical protein R2939_10875 [Kofleriaceae bacterium]
MLPAVVFSMGNSARSAAPRATASAAARKLGMPVSSAPPSRPP